MSILDQLASLAPLQEFKFGHSPLQLEYFQVSNQMGNEKWEYWQHLVQLRALQSSIEEMEISREETLQEIKEAKAFWTPWTRVKRLRKLPRLNLKIKSLERTLAENARSR